MSKLRTQRFGLLLAVLLLTVAAIAKNVSPRNVALIPVDSLAAGVKLFSKTKFKTDLLVARTRPGFHQTLLVTPRKSNLFIQARTGALQACNTGICKISPPLPVTLIRFSGKRLNSSQVELSWTTSTEVNNDHFRVERTLNPANGFETAGYVNGLGNATQLTSYQFTDSNIEAAFTYYRLVQINTDGTLAFSRLIAVKGFAELFLIRAYPNPSDGTDPIFQVSGCKKGESLDLAVYDPNGRSIYQNARYVLGDRQQILLAGLIFKTGMYVIRVGRGKDQASASFVVP